MSFEFSFKPSETVLESIRKLSESQSLLEERRICELSELAFSFSFAVEELLRGGIDICEALSVLSDGELLSSHSIHDCRLPESEALLHRFGEISDGLDKVVFCRLLVDRLASVGIRVGEKDFLTNSVSESTFIYVKNSYADEAYDVFSQEFDSPRVRYAKDFKEALSFLANGEVGYCLLPFEDGGVRIRTVEELIFDGDFKINSVTPVFGFDGTADMKYCLVSNSFLISDYTVEDDRYLELRLSCDNAKELTELLSSAECFGDELYRINSLSFSTVEGEKAYFSVIFRSTGRDFVELLVYLTLFSENSTTLGIYKNLE